MKTLILAAIRCSLIFTAVAVTSLYSVQPAQAYTVTLQQIGANVVANGSGAFNLIGLTFLQTTSGFPSQMNPHFGSILTGPTSGLPSVDLYRGVAGPSNFGSGNLSLADGGSGDFVGIGGLGGLLFVPHGYVSGAALSDS